MPLVCAREWEKRNRYNVYWGVIKCVLVVYKMRVLKYFVSWGIETFLVQKIDLNIWIKKLDSFYLKTFQ